MYTSQHPGLDRNDDEKAPKLWPNLCPFWPKRICHRWREVERSGQDFDDPLHKTPVQHQVFSVSSSDRGAGRPVDRRGYDGW